MTRKSLIGVAFAVLATGGVLAGCGSNSTPSGSTGAAATTTAAADGHNDADVTFTQQTVGRYEQIQNMIKLVADHTTNSKVTDLANQIQQTQSAELTQMQGWLTSWGVSQQRGGQGGARPSGGGRPGGMSGRPRPSGGAMPGGGMPGGGMPGGGGNGTRPNFPGGGGGFGGNGQAMSQLQQANGADFDKLWVQQMVQDEQATADAAKTEQSSGGSQDAKTLAQQISTETQNTITQLNGLLS